MGPRRNLCSSRRIVYDGMMNTTMTGEMSRIAALRFAKVIAADIKLAHSIFALPFAILAAFMAAVRVNDFDGMSFNWRRFGGQLCLIVAAMVLARTVAMLSNRLLDREIDRDNPRTRGRALPSGRLRVRHAVGALVLCAVGFVVVCVGFGVLFENWWPLMLSLPVLVWISAYGLFKRFTAMCHLYLGSGLAIAPAAAALAIEPAAVVEQASVWWLCAMVLFWVSGFDVIYALQDVEVDRRDGLHSIPARFGVTRAMWLSRAMHALAMAVLVLVWQMDVRLECLFGIGTGVVALLLIVEHATVARWGTTKIAMTFLTLNGIISCLLGVVGVVDVLL